ncbi:PAS domain-containing hybrid sensor histidine kinase/response regulator [Pseudomonas oligotrophica]|uniref:PAS domain-containing hybrid sensor histidine kinase/response regulator n=1 Tax=Pseudomonas oligotrophica TaxID=2912055 RepID=UPI001F40EB59|nr:PAS domain-containing protein [Pseudomonas oligotrophica]MCF7200939.1 PAS domain-containing protein [Pseudomonas oligotrophica]
MAAVQRWPYSESEMGERIRHHDWSAGALGASADWPAALRQLVDTILEAPLPMCILWGEDGLQLYNDAHASLLGARHPAALGAPAEVTWQASWGLLAPACTRARGGQASLLHNQCLRLERDGEVRDAWLDLALSPIRDADGNSAGLLLCLRETTQQLRTEQRLSQAAQHHQQDASLQRHSVHRLHLALEASDLIGIWDWDTSREAADEAFELLSRVTAEDAERGQGFHVQDFFAHIHPDDRAAVRQNMQRCLQCGGSFSARYRLASADQPPRWAQARGHCQRDGQRLLRFTGAVMDITRQQASEQALRNREAELKAITDSLPILIGYIDHEQRFRFNNRYYEQWFGHSPQRLYGKTVLEVLGEKAYALREANIRRALAGEPVTFEAYAPHRDGSPRHSQVQYLPRRDEQGTVRGFFVMAQDITERRQAEQALRELNETLESRIQERTEALAQVYERLLKEMASREQAQEALRQAQKMEAVGQLTGGIAHDFNNMLTGIIGGLELIQRYNQSGRHQETGRFIEAAFTSANRAAALTHRLLAFARRQPLNLKRVELNALVESMHDLMVRTLGSHIQVRTQLAADLMPAISDENQLESTLLNLVINARDAMPDGGSLRIATANVELHHDAEVGDLAAGHYVTLSVIDSGCGMSTRVLASAFEPFFTTKPIGQGTGLGLSMIYGFTRQAGGHVLIESEPGVGTEVRLYLPVHPQLSLPTHDEPLPARPPQAQADETVLVVEDDPAVRLLVLDVLDMLGYRALEAAEAKAAVRILEASGRIDLLVTDVGLPGMNGRQLADIARQHRRDLPVLFMTGYAEQAASAGFLEQGMDMISKPFSVDTLAQHVRDMLAHAGEN